MYDDAETQILYDDVFKHYYESEFRAWDIDAPAGFDRHLYDEIIASVELIAEDWKTKASTYRAPSAWAAAIFLMDKQSRQGFLKVLDPSQDEIGTEFQVNTFKIVFRGQNAKHTNFKPALWRYTKEEQASYDVALAAFCWLVKLVSEDGTDLSLQAHLYHAAAQSYEIPTSLLDWTLDPATAITFASSDAANGEFGIVYFTDFETEPQLTLMLPPPFVRQLFDERDFFHHTSSEAENERLFRSSSQVIFPVNNRFARAASFPRLNFWTPSDELLHDAAATAHGIATQMPSNYFEGLDSNDEADWVLTMNKFKSDFGNEIEELLEKHRIPRKTWDLICQRWVQEIHCFINELFVFVASGDRSYISNKVYTLPRENRDAIRLYCTYMLSRTEPRITQKRPLYQKLLDGLKSE
jgi:hypothetical protein